MYDKKADEKPQKWKVKIQTVTEKLEIIEMRDNGATRT